MLVRQAMAGDIPPVFEGTVEIDETYLGGAWRNKCKSDRSKGAKRGRGTSKQAVFGILCRSGQVWAEVVPNVEANTLLPLMRKQVATGSIVCSDTFTTRVVKIPRPREERRDPIRCPVNNSSA